MIKEIRRFFTKHPTRPALADILCEAVKQWLCGNEVILSGFPDIYKDLIVNQSNVGWSQLFLGRFVLEWAELQQEFLKSVPKVNKKKSGTTWVTKVISIMWTHVCKEWDLRNSHQHGIDAETREVKLVEQAIKQTAALYEIRDNVLPRDKQYFYESITEHHEKEPTSRGLRQWLSTWEPVLLRNAQESAKLGTRGMDSIANYMIRQPPKTTNPD